MGTHSEAVNLLKFTPPSKRPARSPLIFQNSTGHKQKGACTNGGLFLSVLETVSDALRLTDEDGMIQAVNRSFGEMFGVDPEECVGKHFISIYNWKRTDNNLTQSDLDAISPGRGALQHEQEIVLRMGIMPDVEVHSSLVESDDGGYLTLTVFRGRSKDSSGGARIHAEEGKPGNELQFRSLYENAIQPMFQSSLDGRLISVNASFLKLLGYRTFDEVYHLDIARDLYADPTDREIYHQLLNEKGCLQNIELRLRRKNGRIITVVEHSRALKDQSGIIIGYEGTLEDITFRKALEEKLNQYVAALEQSKKDLVELNAQKDKIFSILSHDLRSPFASILGFCDILMNDREELTNEERMQFLRFIREAANDQLSLVNKLLDWSRLESGRIRMEMKDIDLSTIARRCVQSMNGLAKQKDITLLSTLPDDIQTRGDEEMVQQVFNNLIGNALKFTPDHGAITVELMGHGNDQWMIGVRDTGIGIPEKDLGKLFKIEEKFTRKGLKGERGTGLGLPVCQEIMEKHSGEISARSVVGTGTTITVSFPDVSKKLDSSVLIVDDENGVRVLHTRFVKRALPMATVIYASDGEEAFAAALKYNPVLIITDYDMPVMNGFEFLSKLKRHDATRNIPVIVISGQDSHASIDQLQSGGAMRFLTKPVGSEQLTEAIKETVRIP